MPRKSNSDPMSIPLTTHRFARVIGIALLCVAVFFPLASQPAVPVISGPVTDLTSTLTASDISDLRSSLMQFEDSTSNQIVVLLIPSLEGAEIRDFGIEVLKKNMIGQKGKNNGVLLLIAKEDRKVSIEVGYGLEGVLTDAISDQIIRNEIRPRFREGDYAGGIAAGVSSIMAVTKGEYHGEKKKHRSGNSDWSGVMIIFIVILLAVVSASRRRRYGISSRGSNIWWGGGGFGGGMGSGGGFGSFGGGGGGGGWSAGGGSFGGGGASGSW